MAESVHSSLEEITANVRLDTSVSSVKHVGSYVEISYNYNTILFSLHYYSLYRHSFGL